jgi:hypothetical protein
MGAVVVQATVTLSAVDEPAAMLSTITDSRGAFEFRALVPGKYSLRAVAPGFSPFVAPAVTVASGEVKNFEIALEIAVRPEQVRVQDGETKLELDPAANGNAIVLQGQDLDALSDDPDDLRAELLALAGPSAGPDGGEIYVDGFSNTSLPPKNAIREIRVNRNPFSAEYDHLGQGRVEVFTKAGASEFHGLAINSGDQTVFDTSNPFMHSPQGRPDYFVQDYDGDLSGPLGKRASFAFLSEYRNSGEEVLVNAQRAPGVGFDQIVPVSDKFTNASLRLDDQLSPNNSLTVRYQYVQRDRTDDGIGQLVESSYGYNNVNRDNLLQIGDTQVLGAHVVNETRLQFVHAQVAQDALDESAGVVIPGADTRGGNSIVRSTDRKDNLELQNFTSVSRGRHFTKFGMRLRANREANSLVNNPNGTFTFASLTAAFPSQYTVVKGPPGTNLVYVDAGLFLQDELRLRRNLTASYGLRYEAQTGLGDRKDFAPRVALAWGVGRGKTPALIVRAGWGMFYGRFAQNLILQARRSGTNHQLEYVVSDPACLAAYPAPPSLTCAAIPTTYTLAPNLRAPYTSQTAVSLERQAGKTGKLALTFLHSQGARQLFLDNVNAPLDADDPISSRPDPAAGNIFEYRSEGIFQQNQLIANANVRAGKWLSLSGYYALNYARSDVSGTNANPGFPSNPYDLSADNGRASFDVRHRLYAVGTVSLPWFLRLSPFVNVNSGQPYNLTVSQDLNGDSIFNDRPGLVSSPTAYPSPCGGGLFLDPSPKPGERLAPINCGTGPVLAIVNLKISKAFRIGKKREEAAQTSVLGAANGSSSPGVPAIGAQTARVNVSGLAMSDGRYTLAFGTTIMNLFNIVNRAHPIGVVGSPLFGQSIALAGGAFSPSNQAANRTAGWGVRFEF